MTAGDDVGQRFHVDQRCPIPPVASGQGKPMNKSSHTELMHELRLAHGILQATLRECISRIRRRPEQARRATWIVWFDRSIDDVQAVKRLKPRVQTLSTTTARSQTQTARKGSPMAGRTWHTTTPTGD